MNEDNETQQSFESYTFYGMAIDPIHVGSGTSRLSRVDNAIVRDPVTKVPKIPGSSLAGVYRAYSAMAEQKYPNCAGQGSDKNDGHGHCGKYNCSICTVFGFAKGSSGGFAGLASFSDAQVLLFPVPTREGPFWITSPMALREVAQNQNELVDINDNKLYCFKRNNKTNGSKALNLGWLMLEINEDNYKFNFDEKLKIPGFINTKIGVVSDKLFSHIVNSNLEVRTSVSINPATGAAEGGALFTYEALPRTTVLSWDVTCKNPVHFKLGGETLKMESKNIEGKALEMESKNVIDVVKKANPYFEHLGIGGMTTRGMGRLRVLNVSEGSSNGGEQ